MIENVLSRRLSKEAVSTPASTVTTTPTLKGGSRKSRMAVSRLSDSDSSENEGTPFPTPSHQIPHPHHSPLSETADRLETSDVMSKEKQKFFRSSAFNADKKRDKKKQLTDVPDNSEREKSNRDSKIIGKRNDQTRPSQNRLCKNAKVEQSKSDDKQKVLEPKKLKAKEIEEKEESKKEKETEKEISSSSSSECSTSSDDSDSSDSESNSSTQPSESSHLSDSQSKCKYLKVPTLFRPNNRKVETFGSVSGLNLNKDGVWGFAAAAAEARKTNGSPLTFATFTDNAKTETNKTFVEEKSSSNSSSSLDRTRSGFGQLKGLFDGLSHLFTAPSESRSRCSNTPNYNPSRRKKTDEKPVVENVNKTSAESVDKTSFKNVNKTSVKNVNKTSTENVNKVSVDINKTSVENVNKTSVKNVNKTSVENSNKASVKNVNKTSVENVNKMLLENASKTDVHLPLKKSKCSADQPSSNRKTPFSNTFFLPPDDDNTQMTPSNLVKKAVDSKRHELERRKFLKTEAGLGFSHNSMLEDARMKKRNLIAEATQTNHPLSVLPITNNQTGKIGIRTCKIIPSSVSIRSSHTAYIFMNYSLHGEFKVRIFLNYFISCKVDVTCLLNEILK